MPFRHLQHLALWALALLVTAPAAAAPVAAAQNATGSVAVLRSLGLITRADLDFGSLLVANAGTVVIDPLTGAITTTGGVSAVGGGAHAATFTATGSRNSVVLIRLPKNAITLTRVGGTQTMTVSNWTLDGQTNRKFPLTAVFDFKVGATVAVAAGQAEGTYVGTFDVTVQYP
jgi:hypothetical protein